MDHSQSRSYGAALSRPPQDAMPMIPPGRFIDIDQKYYAPQPRLPEVHTGFASQGKPIMPYSVPYGKSAGFVPYEAHLGELITEATYIILSRMCRVVVRTQPIILCSSK